MPKDSVNWPEIKLFEGGIIILGTEKLNWGRIFVSRRRSVAKYFRLPMPNDSGNWPVAWVWKIWIMGNIGC